MIHHCSDQGRTLIKACTKRQPIPCPHRWAMGCLLWIPVSEKIDRIITALHPHFDNTLQDLIGESNLLWYRRVLCAASIFVTCCYKRVRRFAVITCIWAWRRIIVRQDYWQIARVKFKMNCLSITLVCSEWMLSQCYSSVGADDLCFKTTTTTTCWPSSALYLNNPPQGSHTIIAW